jgi:hypothetical protein
MSPLTRRIQVYADTLDSEKLSALRRAQVNTRVLLVVCVLFVVFAIIWLQHTLLGSVFGIGGLVVGYECVYLLRKLHKKEGRYATHSA